MKHVLSKQSKMTPSQNQQMSYVRSGTDTLENSMISYQGNNASFARKVAFFEHIKCCVQEQPKDWQSH